MQNEILQTYVTLVHFLGQTFGPDYEVVLHQVIDSPGSIIAIANGHISGRDIGSPITNLAIKMIDDKYYETHDYKLNYRGVSASGKILRCSTFFIKDRKNALIGLLCINFDDSRYRELSEKVFLLCHPNSYVTSNISIIMSAQSSETTDEYGQEAFFNSVHAAADNAIYSVLQEENIAPERLTQTERLKIIERLDKEGIFSLKGTIPLVAEKLACSQASVYRYISQVRNNK